MANTRITGLTEDTTPADDDLVATVDVSDTTQSAQGSTKKVQAQNLVVKKLRTSTGPVVLTVGAVADGEFLKRSGTSIVSAAAGGGGLGDVVGPSGATDNALARYDTTTGKLIQNCPVSVDDAGAITVPEISAPSTPAAGTVVIYAKSDNKVYRKGEDGVEAELGGGSGTTINTTDNLIPYRSNSATFANSFLTHEAANSKTQSSGHFSVDQNANRVIGFANGGSAIAFGGLAAAGQGAVKVVADAAGNPGTILSVFVAPPEPGGNPAPWSSVGMNFRRVLTGNITIGNPGQTGGNGTAIDGYRFIFMLVQDSTGSRTAAWHADFKFPGGTAPTLTTTANAVDIFEFICFNDIAYCIGQFLDVR